MKTYTKYFLIYLLLSVNSIFPQIVKRTLEPTGLTDVYGFGMGVGGYGEYAIVGAPNSHSNGIYLQGLAVVFKNVGGSWEQYQIIIPSDSIPENHFSRAVGKVMNLYLLPMVNQQYMFIKKIMQTYGKNMKYYIMQL